jgi:hypothetical protein
MRIRKIAILFAMIAITACSTPYNKPKIVDAQERILGIGDVLARTDKGVDVILIHGMCSHGKEWVAETNTNLAHFLGSNKKFEENNLPKPNDIEGQTQVYHLTIDVNGKELRTHSIVWSPATAPAKRKLCYDQKEKSDICPSPSSDYPYKRARLNSKFKDILLNDCISDALIYAGDLREHIQNQIKQALLLSLGNGDAQKSFALDFLVTEAKQKKEPLFFISESLGSKVLFDTLRVMKNEGEAMAMVVDRTLGRTMQVFMWANQIPLLSLALGDTGSSVFKSEHDNIFDDPLDAIGKEYKAVINRQSFLPPSLLDEQPDALHVVAFTDPNDLLSYPLRESTQDEKKDYKFTDVIVSNANTWFWLIENPYKAHTGYEDNLDIHRIIACGYPEWPKCE